MAAALTISAAPATAQCRPASERAGELGCWIIAREPLGRLAAPTGWRPWRGIRVAEIGPLEIKPGASYTAPYMEGIFDPGMTTEVHYHPGPEAVYTTAGAICFETPHGTVRGGAGQAVVMPARHLRALTATGSAQRRSIALVVHESDRPWRLPSSDWVPEGLCRE